MSKMPAHRGRGRPPCPQPKRLDYKDSHTVSIRALKDTLHLRVKLYARQNKLPISTTFNRAIAAGMEVLEQQEGDRPIQENTHEVYTALHRGRSARALKVIS